MDTKRDPNTEDKILNAAEKVFIEHGMAGARMQQIADKAGINKALLHYYYRSKEKLFTIIFHTAIKAMIPNLLKSFQIEGDFFTKIRTFVHTYLNFIDKHPHLPGFVIHELSHRPEALTKMLSENSFVIKDIEDEILMEIEKGNIGPIEPKNLIVNVISLCIFPVVAQPMISGVMFKGNQKDFKFFLEARKNHVADFIINSIKTK